MAERIQYFLCSKGSDYQRGYVENMEILEKGIRPKEDSGKKGICISRVMDSQTSEMIWHRMRLQIQDGREIPFRLSIYAGNEKSLIFRGQEMELEKFIQQRDIEIEEKRRCLSPWLQKQVTGEIDILLHEVRGRYFWFLIEMYWQQGVGRLEDICIYFPRQSWIEYLPEVYQREDSEMFLERYLGVFQTIYEDLNEWIHNVSSYFDTGSAQGEYLVWLAKWLGIENSYIWQEETLRRLLAQAVHLYRMRGTRQGLMEFVRLYTGENPYIVEYHQLQPFRRKEKRFKVLQKLYGSSPYVFTVLVREERMGSLEQQKALVKIIEELKPAHMETKLVFMKPCLFVEQYSYIGINSVLGRYRSLVLDRHGALPFVVLEERREHT